MASEQAKALAHLLILEVRITHEENSRRGVSKKSKKEYDKALEVVCDLLNTDKDEVLRIISPEAYKS